eukprot:3583081-Alexandrium_andersonii.AAC.1
MRAIVGALPCARSCSRVVELAHLGHECPARSQAEAEEQQERQEQAQHQDANAEDANGEREERAE